MKIRSKNKYLFTVIFMCLCILLLGGCNNSEKTKEVNSLSVYYIDKNYESIVKTEFVPLAEIEDDAIVHELFSRLSMQPEDISLKVAIPNTLTIIDYQLVDTQLIINFSEEYNKMDAIKEILSRAAIVQTMVQLPQVESVNFMVNSIPLTDSTGALIGIMNDTTFIETADADINSYQKMELHIYLANREGDALLPVTRTLVSNTNLSLEKLIVEQIILGPDNEDSYPVVNPETTIESITVKDGTCYVTLSEEFLAQTYQVAAEVTIYSIVNSLIELSNVNKVQISVVGNVDAVFLEKIPLSTVFERNLEIVER